MSLQYAVGGWNVVSVKDIWMGHILGVITMVAGMLMFGSARGAPVILGPPMGGISHPLG